MTPPAPLRVTCAGGCATLATTPRPESRLRRLGRFAPCRLCLHVGTACPTPAQRTTCTAWGRPPGLRPPLRGTLRVRETPSLGSPGRVSSSHPRSRRWRAGLAGHGTGFPSRYAPGGRGLRPHPAPWPPFASLRLAATARAAPPPGRGLDRGFQPPTAGSRAAIRFAPACGPGPAIGSPDHGLSPLDPCRLEWRQGCAPSQ